MGGAAASPVAAVPGGSVVCRCRAAVRRLQQSFSVPAALLLQSVLQRAFFTISVMAEENIVFDRA